MARRILQMFWWLLLLGILTIFIFLGLGSFTSAPVIAALTHQEEAPGEILYRSQQRLNDASGNFWQVVVYDFKDILPQLPTDDLLLTVPLDSCSGLVHCY